jgi:hypothetical protein
MATMALLAEGVLRARPDRGRGYAPVGPRRTYALKNSRGYRDLERAVPKPAGLRRVVALGDSFAWGAGVEFDDAYPQRLERALGRQGDGRWEVVNLALPGMRTVDEAATLTREGLAYRPDLVLLGYVLNDSEGKDASEARRAAEWTEGGGGPPPSAWDRSALVGFVRGRLWATSQNRRRQAAYRDLYADDAPGWRAARQALLDIGAACQGEGIPLVVAIFPLFGNPMDERYPFAELHARVGEAARAAGARVVDLLPAYRGLRWDLLVVDGAADEHPNELAHRIAADTLLPVLAEVRTSLP